MLFYETKNELLWNFKQKKPPSRQNVTDRGNGGYLNQY